MTFMWQKWLHTGFLHHKPCFFLNSRDNVVVSTPLLTACHHNSIVEHAGQTYFCMMWVRSNVQYM